MANEWNGEYYELCRDCHDYPCHCVSDQGLDMAEGMEDPTDEGNEKE